MSDTSHEPKKSTWWLIGLVITLLVFLIGETGYLIKLRLDERKNTSAFLSARYAGPIYASAGGLSPNIAPPRAVQTPTDPFGPFGGQSSLGDEWDPFREMEEMQRTMNRLFRNSYSRGLQTAGATHGAMSYNPDLDIQETDKGYLLKLDLPGIDKDKVSVKIENNQILVSGERQAEKEQSDEQGGYYHSERSFGSFMRSFPLPADADADRMSAETKNGVLTITIPRIADKPKAAKTVEVQ